ncbi:putative membrane protein [Haloferula luteola]|uniref:Putative membrane protein n=1 Tax=Haloferula luteola TaxID=595692 RepID=A0A840VBE5_9BACT|nr:DUF2254 domain-containing protein [Haloferula luteola]MBB5350211.1 putative membrane protein [Haloferula luteola]
MKNARRSSSSSVLSKWQWRWRRLSEKIWPRVTLYAIASGMVAIAGVFLGPFLPYEIAIQFDADSVASKLSILASSMLAVSTFSLGVMTNAFASAATAATPRVTQLLLADKTSQNVLATFLGAFVFSLVGTITLELGIYGAQGRLLLFVATLAIYVIIVATMVRWVQMLRTFGRLDDSISRVQKVALEAFDERVRDPFLGCHPIKNPHAIPDGSKPLITPRSGYLTHIDFAALNDLADEAGLQLRLPRAPGGFLFPADPLVHIFPAEAVDDELLDRIRQAFSLGDHRTFLQDPRFGMVVLSEIASRALSPAVNDPGTAISILTHGVRILSHWEDREPAEIRFPHLWLEPLAVQELFDDFFRPIARDAAGHIEVQQWIQHSLLGLAQSSPQIFSRACREHSREALARAESSLPLDQEKVLVRAIALQVEEITSGCPTTLPPLHESTPPRDRAH